MAGEEILAHGKIVVEVEENVRRELAQAEAAFDRTMEKLDRKEAELRFHANMDTRQFYKDYREVQARIEKLKKERADVTISASQKGQLTKAIKAAEKQLAGFEQKNVRLYNRINQLDSDRTNAAEKLADQRTQIEEKAAKKIAQAAEDAMRAEARAMDEAFEHRRKLSEKADKENRAQWDAYIKEAEDAMYAEAKAMDAAFEKRRRLAAKADKENKAQWDAYIKEAENAMYAEAKAMDAAFEHRRRLAERADKDNRAHWEAYLRDAENAMYAEARAMDQAYNSRRNLMLNDAHAMNRMHDAEQRALQADSDQVANLTRQYIKLQKQRAKIRQELDRRMFMSQSERLVLNLDMEAADEQIGRLRERLNNIGHPPPSIEFDVDDRGAQALSKWANAITNTAVRIGPFTTSIGGAVRLLFLLGPILTSLVGTTMSLAGAIGGGLVGALGVASAGLTGFLPLMLGVGLTTKSVVSEMADAGKATDAYNKAIREHGKGSDQAKNANKKLQNVLKSMEPDTRAAFKSWQRLGEMWDKQVTKAARKNIGHVMKEGMKTAESLMPMFGKNVKKTFSVLDKGLSSWAKGLRSSEAKSVLNNIFGNTNEMLGPMLSGLGKLGAAFGRVMSAFSNHLPSLMRGFDQWAEKLDKGSQNTGKLTSFVDKMVGSMRAVGKVLSSSGRLLMNFIGIASGKDVGQDALRDLAGWIDRINSKMTANGGRGMANFLKDSVDTAKDLVDVLTPFASLFAQWTTIMRPITTAVLAMAEGFGKLLNWAEKIPGVNQLLLAGFAMFLTGTVLSKILAVGGALRSLLTTANALGKVSIGQNLLGMLTGGFSNDILDRRRGGRGPGVGGPGTPTLTKGSPLSTAGQIATGVAAGEAVEHGLEKGAGKAGGFASAMRSLGSSMLKFTKVAGPVGLGLTGIMYGLQHTSKESKDAAKAMKDGANATENMGKAAKGLGATHTNLATAVNASKDAHSRYESAARTVRRLEEQGKQKTQEYRYALQELNQAKQDASAADKARADQLRIANKLEGDFKAASTAKVNGLNAEIQEMEASIDAAKRRGESEAALKGMYEALASLEARRAGILREQADAQNRVALTAANEARALQGLPPMTRDAAKAVGELTKKLGAQKAIEIAVKFAVPEDAARVSKAAAAAVKSGTPKNRVMNIVANAKNAKDAVAALNRATIKSKTLVILTKGGKEAVKTLEDILGRKLTPQELRIAQRGGPGVIKMLEKILGVSFKEKRQNIKEVGGQKTYNMLVRILGKKIGDKVFNIIARDAASGPLANVQRWLNGLKDKTITVRYNRIGRLAAYDGGAFYSGGPIPAAAGTSPAKASMVDRAAARAEKKTTQQTRTGGKHRTPTFLVGEESRPEYVIATNPAYRDRNKMFLRMAAGDLGMQVHDPKDGIISAYSGTFNGPAYNADLSVSDFSGMSAKKNPTLSKKARKRKTMTKGQKKRVRKGLPPVAIRNPWASRVNTLMEQQSDLEREASIRESQIVEPEDFVVETKNADGTISYSVDQAAVDQYRASITPVRDVYKSLQDVTREITEVVPKAISEVRKEVTIHKNNIRLLQLEIGREERRARTKPKGKNPGKKERDAAEAIRDSAQARLKKLRPILGREKSELTQSEKARDVLSDETIKEAGFDYREFTNTLNTYQAELDNLDKKAAGEVAAAADPDAGGGGGAGGGGDTPLTYGQQAALADTERANILREFGGNMSGTTAPSGSASGGMVSNPVHNGPPRGSSSWDTTPEMSSPSAAGGGLVGVSRAITSGTNPTAMGVMSPAVQPATTAASAPAVASGEKTINITNNFQAPPPDPHSWSSGVAFETGALL